MAFLFADSFQSSLNKLNGEEQKAAKLAAFELQINPAHPGL
jgi:ABC-type cobalamin transport system ATPase subunit